MVRKTLALLTFLLIAALPALAAERVLTIDPAATTVHFTLGATLHTVHGSFRVTRGAVRFDAVPGPASGEVVVDATSGQTGNDKRDKKMHEEVLTSAAFPEIVLVARRIEGNVPAPGVIPASGKGTLTLEGVLRLRGTEHPVKLPVEVEVDGERVHARATFDVPFVAWGLNDPSVFLLRVDKVAIVEVDARGTLTPAAAPAGAGTATPH